MSKHKWKENALCLDSDTNLFFDKYEEETDLKFGIDSLCSKCPVKKECFSVGVSQKEWGVWGGIYLEAGAISREFNKHKTKPVWAAIWKSLTTEQ